MEILRVFVNRWVILFSFLLGAGLIVALLVYLNNSRQPASFAEKPQIVLTQVSAPTPTIFVPSPVPEPTGTPAPTLPAPPPGTIQQGAFVQIVNTGGVGLNLRSEPSRSANINYLGLESEVFIVRDGPVEADGLTWYRLVGFSDQNRSGWGAANYLEIIQNP